MKDSKSGLAIWVLSNDILTAIFSLLPPRDIISSSLVSKLWNTLACSEIVWKAIITPELLHYLTVDNTFPDFSSALNLFQLLTEGIVFDNGKRRVTIDKSTGMPEYHLSVPLGMNVTWSDSIDYWTIHNTGNSPFGKVSLLLDVCWFEISGNASWPVSVGEYEILWRISRSPTEVVWPGEDADSSGLGVRFYWPSLVTKSLLSVPSIGIEKQEKEIEFSRYTISEYPTFGDISIGKVRIENSGSPKILEIWTSISDIEDGRWKSGVYFDSFVMKKIS